MLDPAALEEAQSLREHAAGGTVDLEAAYALCWLHYRRAQAPPQEQNEQEWATGVESAMQCLTTGITGLDDHLPRPILAAAIERAFPIALDMLEHAMSTTTSPGFLASTARTWQGLAFNTPNNHPNQAKCLANFSFALLLWSGRAGFQEDLDTAVEAMRAAIRVAPDDHPDIADWLSTLCNALLLQFRRTGLPAELEEAVDAGRAAVLATPENHRYLASRLSILCEALQVQFERTGVLADLNEAIEAYRRAVHTTPDSPGRASILSDLGVALQSRFERTGALADLDEAIETGRAAVRGTPDDQHHATMLSNLGNALRTRFEHTGALADLDEAIGMGRRSVQTTPDSPLNLAINLSNLGASLRTRFQRTGALADLNEAVEAGRRAVHTTPDNSLYRARHLSNLGASLRTRFERTGGLADLDEAIETGRAAVRAAPDNHPDHVALLTNFGNALSTRFRRTSALADIDEAVKAGRAAVRGTPDSHPDRAVHLSNLGNALRARFEHTGGLADLDEAIETGRAAVRAAPDNHPNQAAYLFNLGATLHARFERTGNLTDHDELLSAWGQAVEARGAPPSIRVLAARAAGLSAMPSDPAQAALLFERGVLMLPEVTPRRLDRGDQQYALGSVAIAGLAADATALALADTSGTAQERAVRALRLAEAGRAVLLSQALETRTDLSDLRDQHPNLAELFSELREQLDRDPAAPGDGTSRERYQLAEEFETLLGRIRACQGFATFGMPPSLDDLMAEAAHGPVVTFNISRYRSDAILLSRDGITSCPLPKLTQELVVDQVTAFYEALSETTAPDADRIAAQRTVREVLEWLWEAAAEPALAALTAMGEAIPPAQDNGFLPRVWWAPSGLLGLLPLHAAGFHTDSGNGPPRRTVMDRVISSYTPTIHTLRHARQRRLRPSDNIRSLIVAMPTTPGLSPLPYALDEARRIQALLPNPVQLTERAHDDPCLAPDDDTPTTATVLAALPECAIAHFACHGASNRNDPSQSLLLLHDHTTTPLTVSTLAQTNTDHADLAYLSACSTADPGYLLDEAIHLTSAFQLAGFPRVVGTLWPIDDRLSAEIAESFYTHLRPSGTLAPDQAAAALHHTIRAVRDRFPSMPSLWAAYLHAGA
ncbi:CHAT domain-containing tetratricopeptide repeat protein [Streptomyces sp. NPDC046853]|uniref:CHAT domain-containing protein n=1 Tax=Streptomyces sp. NPDC046853 TaxID=3154920 RepID=UPI0033C15189